MKQHETNYWMVAMFDRHIKNHMDST